MVNDGMLIRFLVTAAVLGLLVPSVIPKQDTGPTNNSEVQRIVDADQADRTLAPGQKIDWTVVNVRDAGRLRRIKAIYQSNGLGTAKDYANAALVLQHSSEANDFLLAHEMCVVSILKGDKDAAWLAAASEDRFLMNLKRPQRFGTQYRADGKGPLYLYAVDPQVTDAIRRGMQTPTLAEAKARVKLMQEQFGG